MIFYFGGAQRDLRGSRAFVDNESPSSAVREDFWVDCLGSLYDFFRLGPVDARKPFYFQLLPLLDGALGLLLTILELLYEIS